MESGKSIFVMRDNSHVLFGTWCEVTYLQYYFFPHGCSTTFHKQDTRLIKFSSNSVTVIKLVEKELNC